MRRMLEAIDRQGAPSTRPLPIADRAAPTGSTPAPLLGVEPTLDIDGVLEVGELRSLFDTTAFGVVETTADSAVAGDAATSGALGALRARVLRVNSDSQGGDGVQAIIVSSVLLLDTPGGSILGDAKLSVDRLGTGNLITGLPITTERSGWYPPGLDGGGSGFVEVDADNVKLDLAGASCGGAPVQGVRLRIVDGDQIGVQLRCGAVPNQ
jgi:hypothetical protein